MANKEALLADIERLKGELAPVLEADKQRIQSEGRRFDQQSWALGKADSHKYPSGPAYVVRTQSDDALDGA
jgi:hypothetical protein